MGLILTLNVGESFFVEDKEVKIESMTHTLRFKVIVGGSIKRMFTITDERKTEILPNVRVSAGDEVRGGPHAIKVVVDAPKRLKILRGELYYKNNE